MKKPTRIRYLAVVSFFILNSCAQNQNNEGYTIKGAIKGITSGKVKLVKSDPDSRMQTTVDSTGFEDGSFTLKGKVESPEMMSLVVEPGNWSMPVFMENSPIVVKADTAGADHYDWTSYGGSKGAQIKTYTISGSQNQDDWMKYQNDPSLKIYEPVFAKLNKERRDAGTNKEKAEIIKDQVDSVYKLQSALQKKWIDRFVEAHPSSAAGAYMLSDYYMFNEDMPLKDMETLVGTFTGTAKSTVYYKSLSKTVAKREALQPGHTAPDFTLMRPDSTSFTLSSLRGKYVMLDFWASWCIPCRHAIPHWKEVYKKYHPKGLEIVSVTDDIRWNSWFKALNEEKMPWTQVADEFPVKNRPARVGQLFMTPYLPCYILIDKEGKIVLHNPGEEKMDEKLEDIFGS